METVKKAVSSEYFPAATVLFAVLLFWIVGLMGGLSMLRLNQPPLLALGWMLFVYASVVLTPVAGFLAGMDLLRRWRRNQAARGAGQTADPLAG
ncbi:hypothetical protein [Arthrobacter sp. CJ23]|uniref:hypothetical protein n=1 Tax=Arthrobacter sp. CJ23 TaxID=2972479 RepID=UPI00215CE8B0|nr:hypothetical protein [Arthrobacter sp. CJ23]UVJ40258.1 hypothetical protein NVV90_03465 [Arthrobacter sp. CJ23]